MTANLVIQGEDVATAVSRVSLYAFFGMLLGAIVAALGAFVGSPHPKRRRLLRERHPGAPTGTYEPTAT